MSNLIPLSEPLINGNEWKYIKECLDTGWVSSAGKYVERFENAICEFTGSKYAIACVNGTSALQVALRLVGVQPGDEVLVPTITFIAPVNVVRYLNAEPILMDCDEYYNIDIQKTLQFLEDETDYINGVTINKRTGCRISGIIPVHVFGNAVDLEALLPVCRERNIKIVEDATESLGTYYIRGELRSRYTGIVGDIGCYSFNGNKIITTGGGGMIVTNNPDYAEKARYFTTQAKDDPVRYVHNEIGYNFRMTNIQAALGVAQLERLNEFIEIKQNNYWFYKDKINSIDGLHLQETPDYAHVNFWHYALQIQSNIYSKGKEKLMAFLAEKGIQTRPLWYPNHLQKPYRNCQSYQIEHAVEMWQKTLNIPCSVNLTKIDIERVCMSLKDG